MKEILRLLQPIKQQSFFLFGPRGTGKSRWLATNYPEAQLIDLLDEKTLVRFTARPESVEEIVMALPRGATLVIDEVQKAPALLSQVHRMMESKKFPRIQYILTGSSARKLKQAGVDLLAGRAIVAELHPFLAAELGSGFNLGVALESGLVPLIMGAQRTRATLDSYIGLYLREEVKQEGLVRNLQAFSRFLEVMSFSHGETLNLSNVSREAGVKRATVDSYLSILEDLLLAFRIPVFKRKNRKQTASAEKFYYFDTGVFRSIRPKGVLEDPQSSIDGSLLEGLVAQHLRAWISYRRSNQGDSIELSYWRTSSGNEVDFVLYGPKSFQAIEVKASQRLRPEYFSGLRSFKEDYPQAELTLVYGGTTTEVHHGIRCVPIVNFLKTLR